MTKRKGFSLIELLIVVAIIAALVGVAVPFFQDNLAEAQKTKAKQDLDVIRNAINLHDAQNRPLVGTDLTPLLGRYLQELPNDPWGNPYLLDANVGRVISFGADAQADGTGPDEDHPMNYKPALRIQRCQYEGPWGAPRKRNKIIVTLTKPFALVDSAELESTLQLLTNTRDYTDGNPWSIRQLYTSPASASAKADWSLNTTKYGKYDVGIFAFQNFTDVLAGCQPITPTMAINFDTDPGVDNASMTHFGIVEAYLTGGPMDTAIYGANVRDLYQRSPESIPLYQGANRGVKIERF